MPRNVPDESGSDSVLTTAYGHHDAFPSTPYPEYGGSKSVIYRSADGTRVAGVAHESGKCTLTYPCDEFFYVVKGWCQMRIHGGDEDFKLAEGDCIYLKKGTTVDVDMSEDFTNVAVFVDDKRITQF